MSERDDIQARRALKAPPSRIKETQRIDFRPGYFEAVLNQHGRPTLWEKSSACPCRNNAQTSQPNAMCPVCNGLGTEWYDGQAINVIYDNLESNRDTMIAFGTWTFGTARLTMRSEYRPGPRDRYTLLSSVMLFTERRVRRAVRERPRYPIATIKTDLMVTRPDGEVVKRPDVRQNVMRLRLMDRATMLPGSLLVPEQDFQVVEDLFVRVVDQSVLTAMGMPAGSDQVAVGGSIDWTLGDQRGTAPKVGDLYALTYLYHPRYEVVTYNHAIRDDKSKQKSPDLRIERLPLEIMCKLDWDTTQPGAGFGG